MRPDGRFLGRVALFEVAQVEMPLSLQHRPVIVSPCDLPWWRML